jgi:hypothetical protein
MTDEPRPSEARGRGPADPVLVLMHRHHELCARAVDPLEIAAGLEAHGMTDRGAARFRHRDVFSLAEELYARVPRAARDEAVPVPPPAPVRPALHLLPGLVAAAGVALSHAVGGAVVQGAVLPAVVIAAGAAVRRGPLCTRGSAARGGAVCVLWLLAFAVAGHRGGLLDPAGAAALLGPAFALPPAAWCARRFAARARDWLADSQGLAEFAAGVRPLLAGTLSLVALCLAVLTAGGCVLLGGSVAALPALGGPVALGTLLFTARLLAAHGFPAAGRTACAAACVVEAIAQAAAGWADPDAVPLLACGAAALALAGYAMSALARVSAHGCDAHGGGAHGFDADRSATPPRGPATAAHADRAALR